MPGQSDKKTARALPGANRPDPVPRPSRARALAAPFALLVFALGLAPMAAGADPASLQPAGSARPSSLPASTAPSEAVPAPASTAIPSASAPGPVAVIAAFDSLLEAGDLPAAKSLCAGQVLRMFDFLAM